MKKAWIAAVLVVGERSIGFAANSKQMNGGELASELAGWIRLVAALLLLYITVRGLYWMRSHLDANRNRVSVCVIWIASNLAVVLLATAGLFLAFDGDRLLLAAVRILEVLLLLAALITVMAFAISSIRRRPH